MEPGAVLTAGARELEGLLVPQGFVFRVTDEGKSSGGGYVSGEYQRGERRLELHFRWSLGLVKYHVGEWSLGHAEYVRAVQAVTGIGVPAAYPGYSDDPLAAFRHLGQDLERFGEAFLS